MTRQKSEGRVVAQGPGNEAPTHLVEPGAGAKAFPVNEEARQLSLLPETAEEFARANTDGDAARYRKRAESHAAPKSRSKRKTTEPATIDEVAERLEEAFQQVARNKGAPGPDGETVKEVREHLAEIVALLKTALLDGSYTPGDIRRVWIPKSGGGQRGLGIPNVVDRMVQEAVRQVLEPVYEPTFHASSHGFRPGRSCHTAVAEAVTYLEEGYEWVVDLDLEKFFDRVHHQRLMSRLAQRVRDKRLLVLIGQMLKAKVVLPDGVVVSTDEGVPQGGPLSPILSNIVLDELDQELAQRGHRFVRYADDANIYVRSERAGHRVMASIKSFIEKRLRLKVNEAKSAVARPEERHFVGFCLRREPLDGSVHVRLSKRSKERVDAKIRELTPRNWGNSVKTCIRQVNAYLTGWIQFFKVCTHGVEYVLDGLDAHIRRRLRAIQLKHWKRKRTIAKKLIALGIRRKTAWQRVHEGRKSLWALSHTSVVDRALRNSHWDARGLVSLHHHWRLTHEQVGAPAQLSLGWDTARS
ncbi:MAG: group II intron reverse transcriptase/maturase [Planctomycetota bacterium]